MDIILLNVKQEHINRGKRGSIMSCPVALALKDKRPNAGHIRVNCKRIEVGKESVILESRSIEEWIRDFDGGRKVKPFKAILLTI